MTGLCKVCRAMISDHVAPKLTENRAALEFASLGGEMFKHLVMESQPLKPKRAEHTALLERALEAQGQVGAFVAALFLEVAHPQYAEEVERARGGLAGLISACGKKPVSNDTGGGPEELPPAA